MINTAMIPYVIAGLLALGAGGYYLHCEHVKKDRDQFIAQLKADAEAQRRGLAAKEAREKQAKEKADAQEQNELDRVRRDLKRVRDERARASSVPAAPANTSRPDLICFDRAEFGRAVGNFEAGMEQLVGEGAEATVSLNAAKTWALELKLTWELISPPQQ
jgi:hypothetical protein